ncbi:MAG: BON domain-containing protein [Polyangiaceae bacterium]|nr:BON domain-containing protein [Polyangiaceae bacterium]
MNRGSGGDYRNLANGVGDPRSSASEERGRNRHDEGWDEAWQRRDQRVLPYDPSFRARAEEAQRYADEARARWEQYEREYAFSRGDSTARPWSREPSYAASRPFAPWRGRDEDYDFWGRSRIHGTIRERIRGIFGVLPLRARSHENRFDSDGAHHLRRESAAQARIWNRVRDIFVGRGPKNYVRSDDRIREDVCERLSYHPYVDASDVEVVVRNGEVTLSGIVESWQSKRLAEDVTSDVFGVRDVQNTLRIHQPESRPTST